MRFTTKGRYAVSAMLHLAMHNDAGPVPQAEISVCQNISLSYVDQIFTRLRRAGLIQGVPGPGGGFLLARPADRIAVREIFSAMEDPPRDAPEDGDLAAALWRDLSASIDGFLGQITLADFVERPAVREALERQYHAAMWRCETCGAISGRGEGVCK